VVGVLIAMLLAAIDQASVAPAVGIIAADLGPSAFLPWVVAAYFVTATAVTTLYGKIADLYGRRPTLFSAIGIFLLGSALSAAAPDIVTLVVGRALQGLGGAGLMVLAQTVVGDVVPPIERARYAAYISGAWGVASIAGPVIGGVIAEHIHWRAIFLLNLPLGALAVLLCDKPLKRLVWRRREHRLDVPGSALVVLATVALMLALTWAGPRHGWGSAEALGLLGVALVIGAGCVWRLLSAREPLIPIGVLKSRTIAAASIGSFLVMCAYVGLTVFLPIYLQSVHGLTTAGAGLALIAYMAGAVLGSLISARIIPHLRRYRLSAVAGVLVATAGIVALALTWRQLSLPVAEVLMLLIGVGLGAQFPVTTVCVQNVVAAHDLGSGTGMLQFARSLGSAIGIALLGAAAAMSGIAAGSMRGETAGAISATADFAPVFWLAAVCTLAAAAALFTIEDTPLRER
jgi:EmrB/QacA subfamily drug resistance transporter